MKFLIVFVVAASILVIGTKAGEEDDEMLRSLAQDCKEKEGASDADVDTMIGKSLPETKEGKCMVVCMQEQFGIIEDGKFKPAGFMDLVRMKVSDEAVLEKLQKVADECAEVKNDDRCEMGYMVGKCIADKSKEHGVDKDME